MSHTKQADGLSADDAANIAAAMFPDPIAEADPASCTTSIQMERLSFSEDLHWLAGQTGDPIWLTLGEAVCEPAGHVHEAFYNQYVADFRAGSWWPLTPDQTATLQRLAKAVLACEPRTAFELARKTRIIMTLGIHRRIRRRFQPSDYKAGRFYNEFRETFYGIKNRDIVAVLVGQKGFGSHFPRAQRVERFIREAIDDAGPACRAPLLADVQRLKDAGAL